MRPGSVHATGLVAAVMLFGTAAASSQQYSGKLQGHVRSTAGDSLPAAQVLIPETAFGAIADRSGYYFINNLPVGTYTVRGQLIGYAASEVRQVRVLGGQTTDLDITLATAAVTVSEVTVTAAENPMVPRDQVTSKSIVSGQLVNNLPVDDIRNVTSLQPGVVQTAQGLSLRGSRPGEAQVYIDGAPVRPLRGPFALNGLSSVLSTSLGEDQRVTLGTNAVEEVAVTTGAMGVEQGNAESGAISYMTRSGGARWQGSASYETDEPMGNSLSQGVNRFEGSLGGPMPGLERLRLFGSAVVHGIRSSPGGESNWGAGWDQVPSYLMAGIDTMVEQPILDTSGVEIARRSVAVPRFVQVTGPCPTGSDPANPVRDAMLHNYGYACQGGRLPLSWSTTTQVLGKLFYSYGQGSSVSLTGIANGYEARDWPDTGIADPALFIGHHTWSRSAILNLQHQVFQEPDHALALNGNLSWQQDNTIGGQLDPASDLATRDPELGIEFRTLTFLGLDSLPFPITQKIVDNFRTGTGRQVPFDSGYTFASQPYRLNPYGMQSGGWSTQGSQPVFAETLRETRYTAHLIADWQVDRFNRLTLGGEGLWSHVAEWRGLLFDPSNSQAYLASPVIWAAYAADRLDLGDVVLELGLRYDHFNVGALFPNYPGWISRSPLWSQDAATNADSLAASVARVFTPSVDHTALSPRLRVSFPVTERTDIRVSYGQQVQAPDVFLMLRGTNVNNSGFYMGRDADFGKTILFEFGMRHAFTRDLVLDASLYNKSMRSELTFRQTKFPLPPGELSPFGSYSVPALTNLDFGYARGVDIKLDWRVGAGFVSTIGYTYTTSRGTASDPFSAPEQPINQVTGDTTPLAQVLSTTSFDRTHNLVGTVAWTTPPGSAAARALGGVFRGVGVYASFRYLSGFPYTLTDLSGRPVQGINESRNPPFRQVDLRLTKSAHLGRAGAIFYVDTRNLLNFKNVVAVFTTTGNVVDPRDRKNRIAPELEGLNSEAQASGMLYPDSSVDVRDCSLWLNQPNCVGLSRAEARFGNGDGIYTLSEQTRAFNAWYDLVSGTQWYYGPPRQVRIGIELTF